jgi:hypothetical protein
MKQYYHLSVKMQGAWELLDTKGPFAEYRNIETGEVLNSGRKITKTGTVKPVLMLKERGGVMPAKPTNITVELASIECLADNSDLLEVLGQITAKYLQDGRS